MKNHLALPVASITGAASMSRRDAVRLLGLGALGALVLDCHETSGPVVDPSSPFRVPINGRDPLLLRALSSDGATVDFLGARDGSGRPIALTNVFLTATDGGVLRYDFDSTGLPIRMRDSSGTTLQLEWLSTTEAALTVLSPDGTSQLNTVVDFTNASTNVRPATPQPRRLHAQRGREARRGERARLQFRRGRALQRRYSARPSMDSAPPDGNGTVNVLVTQCGLPITYPQDVSVVVTDSTGASVLGTFPATFAGNGRFTASIPTSLAPRLEPSEICESLAKVVDVACEFLENDPNAPTYICAALTAAVAATEVGAAFAELVEAACESLAHGAELYCKTLGTPGGQELAKQLCKSPALDRTIVGSVEISARVLALPSDYRSSPLSASGDGPFPDLSVDIGSETLIRSLKLAPPNPAGGEGYVGTADVFCVRASTVVTLSVVGTDGYTDSDTQTIADTESEGSFTLDVPGGDSGVRDVVTVTVSPPDAAPITLTASLVFG